MSLAELAGVKPILRPIAGVVLFYHKTANKIRRKADDTIFFPTTSDNIISTKAGKTATNTYKNILKKAEPDTSIIRQETIRFWDGATKKRADPHGVHGAGLGGFGTRPRRSGRTCHSNVDTAALFTLKFGEAERAKRLYFCLRPETNTNIKVPYGGIE